MFFWCISPKKITFFPEIFDRLPIDNCPVPVRMRDRAGRKLPSPWKLPVLPHRKLQPTGSGKGLLPAEPPGGAGASEVGDF